MKLNIELNNIAKKPVSKAFLEKVVLRTLKASVLVFLREKNISVSVAVVSPAEIKKINKKYRKINKVTDILSFAEYKSEKELKKAKDDPEVSGLFLGELILCYDDIKEYAKKRGLALEKELANVVSHGVLHLLGFRHGKKMFEIQEKIIKKI